MLDREPPAHTRLRGLVLRAFTSRRIAGLGPTSPRSPNALIDGLDGSGVRPDRRLRRTAAGPGDRPAPRRARGHVADELLAWSHAMVAMYQARRDRARRGRAPTPPPATSPTFLREHVGGAGAAGPADDLITALIAAETAGDRLDTEELIATCVLLLNAGHEATVHAIGNGVAAILVAGLDPALLFADAEATAATVEEVLRFDPPLHLFTRYALEEVELFGHRFRRGDTVGCLLAAANRDPARFPDPGRFDPTRPPGPQLAFGAGIHFCVGAPLARARARHRAPAALRAAARPGARRAPGLRRPLPLPRARPNSASAR